MKFALIIGLASLAATSSIWAVERVDYDLDDDGLIEIQDLQDLNEIRNNISQNLITGSTLYGVSDGCPDAGCNGYELVADLNFDTNENGQFDAEDEYWNEGKGWDPIGSFFIKLSTEFNGNGHTLHNLNIRRPGENFVGLFAYSELSHVHDFSVTGELIVGAESGGLMGYSWKTHFEHINLDLVITGANADESCQAKCVPNLLGGIVGIADESDFNNIIAKVEISGVDRLGGLVGQAIGDDTSSIKEVAIQADIDGDDYIGALGGSVSRYDIDSIVSVSSVDGHQHTSGLIGDSADITLENALVSGALNADAGIQLHSSGGGVFGGANDSEVSNLISLMRMPSLELDTLYSLGAIAISHEGFSLTYSSVFWAKDLALRDKMFGRHSQPGYEQNFDLIDLQCANANTSCNGAKFTDFDLALNTQGEALWEFGTQLEAPVMVIGSTAFGDKDGDGAFDAWPAIAAPVIDDPVVEDPVVEDPVVEDPCAESSCDDGSDPLIGSSLTLVLIMPWLMLFSAFRRRG